MSNLIPTPRTDKNGRTVIRHMKPQSTGTPKNNTPIPAVSMRTPKDRAAIAAAVTQTLIDNLAHPHSQSPDARTRERITEVLTHYSLATLERIQQHEWTGKSANHFSVGIVRTWEETKANDYIATRTALNEYDPNGVSPLHYNSWQHYPELHPANNDGDYPEERLSQLTALYLVTKDMIANDKEPYYWDDLTNAISFIYLDEGPFRDFLLNPGPDYNRDEITRIITTHHTYDPSKIKAMLDLGVRPMTSGVL